MNPESQIYWLVGQSISFPVEVEPQWNRVLSAPSVLRVFIGQSLFELTNWLHHAKGRRLSGGLVQIELHSAQGVRVQKVEPKPTGRAVTVTRNKTERGN